MGTSNQGFEEISMICFLEEYFNGYLLDVDSYSLSADDVSYLDCCCWLTDNNVSIRNAADNFMVSKSSLHRFIHNRLRGLSFELYRCVIKTLKSHK